VYVRNNSYVKKPKCMAMSGDISKSLDKPTCKEKKQEKKRVDKI